MRGIGIKLQDEAEYVHTGDAMGLVMQSKEIGMPETQSYTVQVPGRNGLLNLTKGLTGRVNYYNRTLTFTFFWDGTPEHITNMRNWMSRYHGEIVDIIDDDTKGYYYEGEATLSYEFSHNYMIITLSVDADPFRMALNDTVYTYNLTNATRTVTIQNDGYPVNPTFEVSDSCIIHKGTVTYQLSAGTYTLLADIDLDSGANQYEISGSGTLRISFKEAYI